MGNTFQPPGFTDDTIGKLAYALYEGTPALQNLAETLARKHGKAEALCPFGCQGLDVQNGNDR